MLGHILNAGIRALAASIVLGAILTYAIGGIDSPDMPQVTKASILGFFMFWLVFTLMFGHRVPRREIGSRNETDAMTFHRSGWRREADETNDPASEGDGGGGGGSD